MFIDLFQFLYLIGTLYPHREVRLNCTRLVVYIYECVLQFFYLFLKAEFEKSTTVYHFFFELKFRYSEKATKVWPVFHFLLYIT